MRRSLPQMRRVVPENGQGRVVAGKAGRRILWVGAGLLLAGVAIEILARFNVREEQKKQAYLDGRLFTRVEGQGDAVVFMAGLQASTRYWGTSFSDSARQQRLIFVDALGFGQSPWPDREPGLRDDLDALRRTLVAEDATRNVTLVAHSFGTILAAYYAAEHPGEIRRVILLGTPVFDSEDEARLRIRDMSPLAALFSLNSFFAREGCLLMGATRPLMKRLLPLFIRDVPQPVAEDGVLHNWASIHGAIQNILLRAPVRGPMKAIGPKVVLIHGRRDTITSIESMQQLAGETGASLRIVNAGHQQYVLNASAEVRAAIDE